MREREWRLGGRLLSTAAAGALSTAAIAQQAAPPAQPQPPSADIDPSAPLAPMPDIGVDWPTIGKEAPQQQIPGAPQTPVVDAETDRVYTVGLEGLDHIGDSAGLIDQFQQQ